MTGEIQTLFNMYQQKYKLFSKEAIVELMLDDGVISFDTAKKIKSGTSIFLLDSAPFKPPGGYEADMTEIMGGFFTKNKPETNFNKNIEPTRQPMTQGDCWLLSDINSLNCTAWGKKAISDAIVPDTDGSGGVTVKFAGSPLKQKEIHITSEQIQKAKESGNYSDGDDDMIALELAAETTFKEMVKQGLAVRAENDEFIEKMGGKYRSYIFAGIKTDKFDQFPISELLGVKTKKVYVSYMNELPSAEADKDNLLKYVSENKNNISAWCAFNPFVSYGDKNSKDYIHNGHAYAIKSVNYGKDVILSDPHYSDYEIKVPWDVFNEYVMDVTFSFKDSEAEKQFMKNALPPDYESNQKSQKEGIDAAYKELLRKMDLE